MIVLMRIKSRRMRWAGHVARMGNRRGAHRILVGRPRHRWRIILTVLHEVGWRVRDWIDLAQDRDRCGGSCECCNELLGSIKCGKFLELFRHC